MKKSFVKRHRASFCVGRRRLASLLPVLLPEGLWPLLPSFHADVCTYCLVLSLNVLSALLFADRAMGAAKS